MVDERPMEGGSANTPPFPLSGGPERPFESPNPAEGFAPTHGDSPSLESEASQDAPPPLSEPRKSDPLERPRRTVRNVTQDARDIASEAGERLGRRAGKRVQSGFSQVADRLEDTAERIDRLADDRFRGTGARGRAGDMAHSTAGMMEEIAEYLRESDFSSVQKDLEQRVRDRPIQTLLLAAGVGWLVGKIMK
jgi:ElaB/YqjD/DUF883 family membrane-anchored ribosome-binding protein